MMEFEELERAEQLKKIFEPYIIYNEEEGGIIGLADNAPKEAIDAYKEWEDIFEEPMDEYGIFKILA